MTQIGEPVMMGFVTETDPTINCDHKDPDTKWKCNLDGDSAALATDLGNAPNWDNQTHHLVPWKQLKKHEVAKYLSARKNYLTGDTYYNVDHKKNGYFMPYASGSSKWQRLSSKKKQEFAEQMMDVTGIQLHQGAHSNTRYECAEQGYKEAVKIYLDMIHNSAISHYKICPKCISKQNGKRHPPRKQMVMYVDKASQLLHEDLKSHRIFVSHRAAIWACKKKLGV